MRGPASDRTTREGLLAPVTHPEDLWKETPATLEIEFLAIQSHLVEIKFDFGK